MTSNDGEVRFVRTGEELERELSGWPWIRKRLRAVVICLLYPIVRLLDRLKLARCSMRAVLYHHVFDDQRESFRRHLTYLSEHFEFVDVERFLALLSGKERLEGRSKLLVTFDDGFRDNLTNALPVLEEFGVKAVFFVSTAFVSLSKEDVEGHRHYARDVLHSGRPVENLSWSDVAELVRRGHAVGSHTVTHARLSELSADDTARELAESRRVLREKLGRDVPDLSFPYGRKSDYPADLGTLARAAGYRSCFNMVRGKNLPGDDPYFINREALDAGWPLIQVRFFMRGR